MKEGVSWRERERERDRERERERERETELERKIERNIDILSEMVQVICILQSAIQKVQKSEKKGE